MSQLSRRAFVGSLVAAAAASRWPSARAADATTTQPAKPWLLFTKSQGFEHEAVKLRDDGTTLIGRTLAPLFAARGIEVVESKDGAMLAPEAIGRFGGFAFYTTGDLTQPGTDKSPPAPQAGVDALLAAVAGGTPFVGIHSASDTFRPGKEGPVHPYIAMLGGGFLWHGKQQRSSLRVVEPAFPGAGTADDWRIEEEWYVMHRVAADIKPIHQLDTQGMDGDLYTRQPLLPLTWTRQHGKGRVFYTGLGHRRDVIESKAFAALIGGALDWCRGA